MNIDWNRNWALIPMWLGTAALTAMGIWSFFGTFEWTTWYAFVIITIFGFLAHNHTDFVRDNLWMLVGYTGVIGLILTLFASIVGNAQWGTIFFMFALTAFGFITHGGMWGNVSEEILNLLHKIYFESGRGSVLAWGATLFIIAFNVFGARTELGFYVGFIAVALIIGSAIAYIGPRSARELRKAAANNARAAKRAKS